MRRSLFFRLVVALVLASAVPLLCLGLAAAWREERALQGTGSAGPLPSLWVATGLALGLSVLLSCAVAALLARSWRRPLQHFSAKALELAQGKFGVQVDVKPLGDLDQLGSVFNYMSQQLLAYDGENRRLYENLEEGYLQTMLALATVIDSKDSYTLGHSQRVGFWSAEIGKELGLTELEVKHLLYGGILHDVGKIGVMEPILHKRAALTSEEMDAMRAHPVIGATIIGGVRFLKPVLSAVRHHHERWDGTGYPDKLKGEKIPLMARIVGAVDVWDACTSTRSYQQAMPTEQALQVLHKLKETALDPRVVDAIERLVRKKQQAGELVSPGDYASRASPKIS